MSRGGTASYQRLAGWVLPDLVSLAVGAAERLDFELCVRPEIGRLLAVLAGGLPPGSLVGESGTGTGAGLAWMVSAADPAVRFISYECEPDRARAATEIFRCCPNGPAIDRDPGRDRPRSGGLPLPDAHHMKGWHNA
jgi:hypothetical protein